MKPTLVSFIASALTLVVSRFVTISRTAFSIALLSLLASSSSWPLQLSAA